MIIPDICNVLSTSGKEFSLSHWYSPIIDSWVTKIEVQRKHLFQIFRIYWIDSLFNMQVFWDLRMQWSNCPYFVAKKDLHWIYLVEKGKSGYSCQDAKFRSTPTFCTLAISPKNVHFRAFSSMIAKSRRGSRGPQCWLWGVRTKSTIYER